MSIRVVVDPTFYAATLADLKLQARVTSSAEDALLNIYLAAATQIAEHECNRSICTQTLELSLDQFVDEIELPRPVVQSIQSVQFVDEAGVLQTINPADYVLDNRSEMDCWLLPAVGKAWPATRQEINSVRIRYIAGWAQADVPKAIQQWVLLQAVQLYENRVPVGDAQKTEYQFVKHMLDRYRVPSF